SLVGQSSFKSWERAEVAVRIITHTCKGQVDQSAVIGLEGRSQIEFDRAVGHGGHPVAAAGRHPAAEALPHNRAADDSKNRESTMPRCGDLLDGRSRQTQHHERTRLHVRTLLSPT